MVRLKKDTPRHRRPVFLLLKQGTAGFDSNVICGPDFDVAVEFQETGHHSVLKIVGAAGCAILFQSRGLRSSDDAGLIVVDQLFRSHGRSCTEPDLDVSVTYKVICRLIERTRFAS